MNWANTNTEVFNLLFFRKIASPSIRVEKFRNFFTFRLAFPSKRKLLLYRTDACQETVQI